MLLILAGLRWSSALEIEEEDWLIDPRKFKTIYLEENNRLRLTNGLIQRDFTFEPNFGTIDFHSVEDDSSLLRAFSPEAQIIVGTENQNCSITVGGFNASISRSYLNRTNSACTIRCKIWIITKCRNFFFSDITFNKF